MSSPTSGSAFRRGAIKLLVFIFVIVTVLLAQQLYISLENNRDRNRESHKPTTIVIENLGIKNSEEVINFKAQKKRAFDSLVENKQLTPEALKALDIAFPDSLCHCD